VSRHGLPETTARLAAIVNRAWLEIADNPRWYDAAQWAAVRILADREIAAGIRALPVIAALDARHQPRPWAGSSTGCVCTAGCGAYPCIDRQILDGTTLAAAVAS
jgi:hypothetical protein